MTAESHVDVLRGGRDVWNRWRADNPSTRPVLAGAHLEGVDLRGYDLAFVNGIGGGVDLSDASLAGASLQDVDLRCAALNGAKLAGADLSNATLGGTELYGADLRRADLSHTALGDFGGADLGGARLVGARAASVDGSGADLSDADLGDATFLHVDLQGARLNGANIAGARLIDCRVFGTAAWGLRGVPAEQRGLMLTPITADVRPPTGRDMRQREAQYDAALTVDRIDLAPLVYSVLNRDRFSEVIDTFTSKVVLILGRFTSPRMEVLQAMRQALAAHRYLPVVFDFAAPWQRDLTETISTLAHLSRFVVADLTDAKSIPQELGRIVPILPSVPVVPIMHEGGGEPYAMFEHLRRYPWVLDVLHYATQGELVAGLQRNVIDPAEAYLDADQQ